MDRYILVSQKQISHVFTCEECHEIWYIEKRIYKDMNNPQTDATVETSVRTSCACTKERDVYIEANKSVPYIPNISKGFSY